MKYDILNTYEYGNLPQNRERIYIVAFRDKIAYETFSFPSKIPLTKDIVGVLDDHVDASFFYDGKPLYDRLKNDVVKENMAYQWRRQYVRANKKGIFPTLTANM